jgi:hypothetical protein
MQQADFSLPPSSSIELLLADYEVAIEEKKRAYALSEVRAGADGPDADAKFAAAEAAADRAYEAAEDVADMILALPARSTRELAIKVRVLSARDPYHQVHHRPEDLTRFLQEVSSLALSIGARDA